MRARLGGFSPAHGRVMLTFTSPDEVLFDVAGYRHVIVSSEEFEELADEICEADPFRAELKRSLDDALSQIQRLSDERDEWRGQSELWKSLAERQDNTAPLRTELRIVERERDELKRHTEYLRYQVQSLSDSAADDDVDELKATIVRQAREITRLKGESE